MRQETEERAGFPLSPRTMSGRLVLAMAALLIAGGLILQQRVSAAGLRIVQLSEQEKLSAVAGILAPKLDGAQHEEAAARYPEKDQLTSWSEASGKLRELQATLASAALRLSLPSDAYTLRLRDSQRAAVASAPDRVHPEAMEFVLTSSKTPYWRHSYQYRPEMGPTLFQGQVSTTDIYDDEHGHWLSAYAPVTDSAGRVVALLEIDAPPAEIMARVEAITREQLRTVGAVGLGLVLAVLAVAVTSLAPLRRLSAATERLIGGDYSTPIQTSGVREIARVARGLESARCAIQRAFARQRELGNELAEHNQEMRLVLDNVRQGFLTLGRDGVLATERSAIVDTWFGAPQPGARLEAFLAPIDPDFCLRFEINFEQLIDGFMPLELLLEQLPSSLRAGDRSYEVTWVPVHSGEELQQLLVVITDITERLLRESAEAERREFHAVVERILSDRAGFMEFFTETGAIIARVCGEAPPVTEQLRDIHTIKGNCGIYGLTRIAHHCHALETRALEAGGPPVAEDLAVLGALWGALAERLSGLLDRGGEGLDLSQADLEALEAAIAYGAPPQALLGILRAWRFEPAERRLERIADQASALAGRLGKGSISVAIDGGGVRMDPAIWSGFWSSFIHVVRNSVDHGLETPAVREAAGKPPGRLSLTVAQRDGWMTVSIADDGAGIDWETIRAKAADKGLPHQTRAELIDALFADGLSSRDAATETSGRGVGMGATRAAIRAMGGRVELRSEPGAGTTFTFMAPCPAAAQAAA